MEHSALAPRRYRIALLACLTLVGAGTEVADADTVSGPTGTVVVSPYRILDTRQGIGAPAAAVGGGQTIAVQIAGVGPVPADATGVILNLTGTQVTDETYVSAWPAGEVQSTTSVLNLTPGIDSPNMITAALGAGGALNLYNFTGTVHLVADIAGYLIPGGGGTPGPAGPQGPQGAQGPPGDPDVVAGTTTLANADWATGSISFSNGPGLSLTRTARLATIVVPELTQAIIDRGSVEVAIRPYVSAPGWEPVPLNWSRGTSLGYRVHVDVRYTVGTIVLAYTYQWEDPDIAIPNVATATLPDVPVRWVIRPG